MTADQLVEILKSRGCEPEEQCNTHAVRDAVHETVHVLQSGSRSYERERLHNALCRKADHDKIMLVRFELQARAVEMLVCKQFKIPYELEDWAWIMWRETLGLGVNIGDIERCKDAIMIVSRQYETKRLVDRVLGLRMRRKKS